MNSSESETPTTPASAIDAWIVDDPRRAAIYAGRARCVVGALLLVMPRWAARLEFGPGADTPTASWLLRMLGLRDIVLGLGTVISASERRGGAGWASMGALTDAGDGLFALGVRGLPVRSRTFVVPALISALLHWRIAKALAPEESGR
jgi:hypothetical protein